MTPYIIITFIPILALCLEWFKEINNSHKYFIMIFIAISSILFSGLRWECGTDWEQFYGLFYSFKDTPITEVFNHPYNWVTGDTQYGKIYEPGYALMNWLFVNTTGSFTAMLVFYTAVIVFMFFKLSWLYAPQYPIYLFTFFITGHYFFWRAGFAATICFFAIQYIISHKFLKFLLCIIVATSMHNSAILVLPFYFILNRTFSSKSLIITYLFCAILGNTSILYNTIDFISGKLSFLSSQIGLIAKLVTYLDAPESASLFKLILSIFKYGIFVILFCWCRKFYQNSKKEFSYNVMLNAYVCASCIWLLFRTQLTVFVRFATYFTDSFPILSVFVLGILPKNKRKLFFIFLVLNFMYIAFAKFINGYADILIPYKTIIFDR